MSGKHSKNALKHALPKPKRTTFDKARLIVASTFIAAGLGIGGYLAYQTFIPTTIEIAEQQAAASEFIESFETEVGTPVKYDKNDPPVTDRVAHAVPFGVIYIPRLDPNFKRVIAEGTTLRDVLSQGVGHYEDSQMPGEIGNFAVAGHRDSAFPNLKSVVPGDLIYVQTAQGYYTYKVTAEHYIVTPDAIEVTYPVPNEPGVVPTESIITLTTCWPEWSNTERLILHATFLEWRPLAAGPPAAIKSAVNS